MTKNADEGLPPSLFDMMSDVEKTEKPEQDPEKKLQAQDSVDDTGVVEDEEDLEEEDDSQEDAQEDQEEDPSEDNEEDPQDGDEGEDGSSPLVEYLQSLGVNTDGLTDKELKDEIASLKEELEKQKESSKYEPHPRDIPKPEPKAESEGKPETAEERRERLLKKLDPKDSLAAYVTYNERGVAIPKEEYGDKAVEAAKQINEYNDARRERLAKIVDDPLGTLEPDQKSFVDDQVKSAIEAYKKEQEEAAQRASLENKQRTEEEKVQKFFQDKKQDLYILDDDGEPKKVGLSKKLAVSEVGRVTEEQFSKLYELAPTAPQSVLLERAFETAKQIVEARAPKESPEEKAAPKKKKMLASSKKRPKQPDALSDSVATPEERQASGERVSLLQLILDNPELEGSSALAGLR